MNKQLFKEIKEDIEAIQMDYDTTGYLSTNQADDLIRHCQLLLKVAEAKEVVVKMPGLPESEVIKHLQNQVNHWQQAYYKTYHQLVEMEGRKRAASTEADLQ